MLRSSAALAIPGLLNLSGASLIGALTGRAFSGGVLLLQLLDAGLGLDEAPAQLGDACIGLSELSA
jgi:hypothetical protein